MEHFVFSSPLFLIGLSVLIVPVILHFINRQISRKMVFPKIHFIHQAQRRHSGKKQIRDWLLLLIRMLLLTLIVMLFAAPVIVDQTETSKNALTEIVLFFDLSISMNNNVFSDYVKRETEVILNAHPNARFSLLASSNKIDKILSLTPSTEQIRAVVEQLEATNLRGNHHDALMAIGNLFSDENTANRIVYLFSDLQSVDWNPSRLPTIKPGVAFVIVKPEHSNMPNAAVLQARAEAFVKNKVRMMRVFVDTHYYSLTPTKAKIRLTAGNAVVVQDIDLHGGYHDSFTVDLAHPNSDTAVAEIVTDEPFQMDNSYHFWIGPQKPVRIAIVADLERHPEKRTQSFFLYNALTVSLPGTEKLDVQIAHPEFIWDQPLRNFQAVFVLDSLTTYTESELDLLKDYLTEGGLLVYFSGEKTAQNIAKLNAAGISRTRFAGYRGEINQLRAFNINIINMESQILSVFHKEASDLLYVPIYKFSRLIPYDENEILLTLQSGNPFLMVEHMGDGALFMFAINASTRWSELPSSMSFLPMIRSIVSQGKMNNNHGTLTLTIGEDYGQKLVTSGLPHDIRLKNEPGVVIRENIPLEMNVTRMESDLKAADEYAVLSALTTSNTDENRSADIQPVNQRESPKSVLAALLMALFLTELIFANRKKGFTVHG